MARWSTLLGLVCEVLMLVLLSLNQTLLSVIAIALHTLGSYWLALSFWSELPRKYKVPVWRSLSFLAIVLWILPVVGVIGLWWCLVVALRATRTRAEQRVRVITLPELPFSPPVVHSAPPYSQGALRQIVRFAERPIKRLKAVMATRHMSAREAVPVWVQATRDRVDDVRLLAYAMMDGSEKKLNDRINQLMEELQNTPTKMSGHYHHAIAELCWELSYHNLVQGAVRQHWLHVARSHLDQALALAPRASAWVLSGRLSLVLNDLSNARVAFMSAQALGLSRQSLLPYLAEVAFRERHFSEVRSLLSELTRQGELGRDLAQIKVWWNP